MGNLKKNLLLLGFILISLSLFSQAKQRNFRGIKIIENEKMDVFKNPNSILFYAIGHEHFKEFFEVLFEKLAKEFDNSGIDVAFEFQDISKLSDHFNHNINSDAYHTNINFDITCILVQGKMESSLSRTREEKNQRFFYNHNTIYYLDLIMKIVESDSDKLLQKTKFQVKGWKNTWANNQRLAKQIGQNFK